MTTYAHALHNRGATPQTEPARNAPAPQTLGDGGGYLFTTDPQTTLERFLILGSDSPTYYVNQKAHMERNVDALLACIAKDGENVVRTIVAISQAGRAPKQDPGIFALALCAGRGDAATRKAALLALPSVCRTGSTLLQFVSYIGQARGWGRSLRTALAKWYTEQAPSAVAYQVTKYRNRFGWTHRDVFRKAHPTIVADEAAEPRRALADFILGRPDRAKIVKTEGLGIVAAFLDAEDLENLLTKDNGEKAEAAELGMSEEQISQRRAAIVAQGLTHEMIPTRWKNDLRVWAALLPSMPITAMIRNLATMTANGFLAPGNAAVAHIVERLTNPEAITKARVHPIALLIAMRTYAQGHGEKGSLTWIPVPEIVGALDAAFYLAFGNVVPAGKRTLVALDVSDSMTWPQNTYSGLKAREACAAMAMIQVATEPTCEVVAFSDNIATVPLRPNQRLADVTSYVGRLRASSTDCSLPMLWAIKHQRAFDTFVIYTDNETNFGIIHPFQALRQYRNATGIDAKLVVCATTATPNTIADPTDKGMLDISGFDASVPTMIADFSRA